MTGGFFLTSCWGCAVAGKTGGVHHIFCLAILFILYLLNKKKGASHGPTVKLCSRPNILLGTTRKIFIKALNLCWTKLFSRPVQSQGLLYKHLCHWLIDWLSHPFPLTALRHRHAQTVIDSSLSYKIDYVIVIKSFLNSEGHQNCIVGSKVTVILLNGLILPIGGVALRRVCACSLRSRLVFSGTEYNLVKKWPGAVLETVVTVFEKDKV